MAMVRTWEQHELVRVAALGIGPETQACYNCAHFHKHYNEDMAILYKGQCSYPRMKFRRLDDTCIHFQNKSAPSGAANT